MFDNIVMDRPGAQDNIYEVPTRQMIVIRGQSPVENVTLPNLQTYYNNLQMPGRQYGSFQITHFDFPIYDSLTKIVSDGLENIYHSITIYLLPADGAAWDTDMGDEDVAQGSSTINLNVRTAIQLKRVHTLEDLAALMRRELSNAWDLPNASGNIRTFLSYFSDISYDPVSNKFVLTYSRPQTSLYPLWHIPTSDAYRINWRMSGQQQGTAATLLANCFGGVTTGPEDNPTGWYVDFNTGSNKWFKRMREASVPYGSMTVADQISMQRHFSILEARSMRPTRMFTDPYVYIRGTPEQSVWEKDGESSNILAVLPRNRQPGMPPGTSAYVASTTHQTKTSLSSLRSMVLKITDRYGNLLQFDEDYILKIAIDFQL